jgi:hypothetical protein
LRAGSDKADQVCALAVKRGAYYDDPSFPGDAEERWHYVHAGGEIETRNCVEQSAEVSASTELDAGGLEAASIP